MKSSDYITKFESYLLTEKRVAKNTFDAYKRDLEQFARYLTSQNLELEAVIVSHLKDFLKYLHAEGIGARSAARKISCLKSFYSYLCEHFNFNDHAHDLTLPRIEKKLPQFLKEEEIKLLFETAKKDSSAAGIRNAIMLQLLYVTGLRISELVHLTVSSIDFSSGFLMVSGKGGKDRMVPLPQHMLELLSAYLETTYPQLLIKKDQIYTSEFLFPTLYGGKIKAMSRQLFWMYLKEIAVQAGIQKELSPHQLRHSLATHLLKKGANLRSLQVLLGHEQLATVQIYTHVETEHLRKVYDKKHPRS